MLNFLNELTHFLYILIILSTAWGFKWLSTLVLSLMQTETIRTGILRTVGFVHSLTENHDLRAAHRCVLVNCSKAPSFGDTVSSLQQEIRAERLQILVYQAVWHGYNCPKGSCYTYADAISMGVRGGKGKGLRWITSSSFGDGEGIWDIILLMLTREFLTDYILGRGWNFN